MHCVLYVLITGFKGFIMKAGIGGFLWKSAVALYLIANGVLGLFFRNNTVKGLFSRDSDFEIIFNKLFSGRDLINALVVIASVIALVAGILIVLEMLSIKVPLLDTLLFIIAIIWAAYIVVNVVVWIGDGFKSLWPFLQTLAVHTMVLSSLLIASKRFD